MKWKERQLMEWKERQLMEWKERQLMKWKERQLMKWTLPEEGGQSSYSSSDRRGAHSNMGTRAHPNTRTDLDQFGIVFFFLFLFLRQR